MAPQNTDASELLVEIQHPYPAQDREGWEKLGNDKQQLYDLMKHEYEDWSPLVRSAMDATPLTSLSIWAFHTMPRLSSWSTDKKRAVIIGDAAHA